MKALLFFAFAVMIITQPMISQGQIPRLLSYHGILADSLDNPKPDGLYSFTFRLYTAADGGSPIWTETKSLQVKRGLFSTMLGNSVVLDAVPFDRAYWLSIQVSPDPELSARIPLSAVGYSLASAKSDTARYALGAPGQTVVDSARIASSVPDNAVGSSKIANNAVTSAKIADGTIQFADISQNDAIPGQVMKWNGSAWSARNDSAGSSGPWLLNGSSAYYKSGNVGIGRSNPGFPLSFADTVGDKISLYGASGDHYGIGVQPYQLQIHADQAASDIAFGYGSSGAFTEMMRIRGNGTVGIGTNAPSHRLSVVDSINGLRVETDTPGGTVASFGGIGDFRVDSNGQEGGRFIVKENGSTGVGTILPQQRLSVAGGMNIDQSDFNIGTIASALTFGSFSGEGIASKRTAGGNLYGLDFYTGSVNRMSILSNGNVGIGTSYTQFPLGFANSLGDKISLFGDYGPHYGFGIQAGQLQIYTDQSSSDVVFGSGSSASFTENFRIKGNGAISLHGSAGVAGQVLASGGPDSAARWAPISSILKVYSKNTSQNSTLLTTANKSFEFDHRYQIRIDRPSILVFSANFEIQSTGCPSCTNSFDYIKIVDDNGEIQTFGVQMTPKDFSMPFTISNYAITVSPGVHNYAFQIIHPSTLGTDAYGSIVSSTILVLPQ